MDANDVSLAIGLGLLGLCAVWWVKYDYASFSYNAGNTLVLSGVVLTLYAAYYTFRWLDSTHFEYQCPQCEAEQHFDGRTSFEPQYCERCETRLRLLNWGE